MRAAGAGCGCALVLLVLAVGLAVGSVAALAGGWAVAAAPTGADAAAVAGIPPAYLALYQQAAARFGLDWEVLAAVGEVETGHGRNRNGCAPNAAGARGPMQFLAPTFAHAARLAGIAHPDVCDPADAIPAAAAYLQSNGAPADWQRALFRYNPADWYPPLVMGWARRYGYGATAAAVWPVAGGRVTQGFGPTALALEPPRCWLGRCYAHFHAGLDIAAPLGSPVRAIAAGRVTIAGRVADGAVVVQVEHAGGVTSLYGHLQPGLPVRVGDDVVAGQAIGAVGVTGNTTGPHLHLEVDVAGAPVDPLTVLPPSP